MTENLRNCRLCQTTVADVRLMLNVFDSNSNYARKIEDYLKIKLHPVETHTSICMHCSNTIDNFDNFATKIQQIQKIIYSTIPTSTELILRSENVIRDPEPDEVAYEICVLPEDEDKQFNDTEAPLSYKVTTIRATNATKVQEKVFDALKFDGERSQRSFELEENTEIYEVVSDEEAARDADTDWPSCESLKKIPSKLVDSKGLLIYKGAKLMKMMSNFYDTKCELCGVSFKGISNLFDHYKSKHKVEPFVNCCSTKLSRMPRIIWHFVAHIQPESFKCHICGYAVSRPKFLELHLQTHTDQKPFSCDLCDKRFIWKGAIKTHILTNHQAEKKTYECPTCHRTYQTAGSLSSHKKTAHGQVRKAKHLCEVCSKSFSTLTSYKEHMITHSEDSGKMQLKCPECGTWLKNQRCYKSHMQLHNSVDYCCEVCNYVTKKEKLLKNHMLIRHTNEKPWSCDQCDKSFKVKRALTIHKSQAHTNVNGKSCKTCEFCGREFASSTNYYTHRKNLHSAELQQMIDKKKEEEKKKRIEIGLE